MRNRSTTRFVLAQVTVTILLCAKNMRRNGGEMNNSDKVKVFKAFCDERRIEILNQLNAGEKCACKLLEEVDISQATLSHHMKILCDSGIVNGRKDGKWMHYSINKDGCILAENLLKEMIQRSDSQDNSKDDCCTR